MLVRADLCLDVVAGFLQSQGIFAAGFRGKTLDLNQSIPVRRSLYHSAIGQRDRAHRGTAWYIKLLEKALGRDHEQAVQRCGDSDLRMLDSGPINTCNS